MKSKKASSLALAERCCRALDEKKAEDLRILRVDAVSSITDYLIIASATSETHLRALRIEIERVLDASQTRIVGVETAQESGWTVVDAFDVMVHLFIPERRLQYRLEALWKDAEEIPVSTMLKRLKIRPKPVASKKRPSASARKSRIIK